MTTDDLRIDDRIDQQHEALQRAEQEALQIGERITRACPELRDYVKRSKRSFGNPPNPWAAGDDSLTAQALIQRADPALAGFLARAAGKQLAPPDYAAMEREQQRAASATRMAEATQQLRARNDQQRRRAEHIQTYGRYSAVHGRVI